MSPASICCVAVKFPRPGGQLERDQSVIGKREVAVVDSVETLEAGELIAALHAMMQLLSALKKRPIYNLSSGYLVPRKPLSSSHTSEVWGNKKR